MNRERILRRAYELLRDEVSGDEKKIGEFTKLVNEVREEINTLMKARKISMGKGLIILDLFIERGADMCVEKADRLAEILSSAETSTTAH